MRIAVYVHANDLVWHQNYDICSSFEMKNERNALEAKPTNLDTHTYTCCIHLKAVYLSFWHSLFLKSKKSELNKSK